MYKTIGIIGGMGPAATCDLMSKIVKQTDANDDQHHIHVCVDCNTNIPDRTEAILHHGKSPVPELVKSAIKLQTVGANVLVMPCNTAHYFYDNILSYLDIPLLNMPEETARYLKKQDIHNVGIMATDGTLQSHVYDKALNQYGITPVYPEEFNQKVIMSLIYDYIKKGITDKNSLPEKQLENILDELKSKGAQKIILACTELPIAFQILGIQKNTIDPTQILAEAAIHYVGAQTIMDAVS
ncbi:MAG: amino acid racemase [Lachnospiraceae bacterium]|nr:amino acid racemase [Lachnospiraceae bacterium]